jgi:hypothetical protein
MITSAAVPVAGLRQDSMSEHRFGVATNYDGCMILREVKLQNRAAHLILVSVVFSATVLRGQSTTHDQSAAMPVHPGMQVERTLLPSEEQTYSAQLESGAAIIGEIDQEGIDVVIDVNDPDGAQITRLDSSNGADGAEPIDLTALKRGAYKFVVHAADKNASQANMS